MYCAHRRSFHRIFHGHQLEAGSLAKTAQARISEIVKFTHLLLCLSLSLVNFFETKASRSQRQFNPFSRPFFIDKYNG